MRKGVMSVGLAVAVGLGQVKAQVNSFVAPTLTGSGAASLSAPYTGTIGVLRELSEGIPAGEVMTHVEPTGNGVQMQPNMTIQAWVPTANWDRSTWRLFKGLNASAGEVLLRTAQFEDSTTEGSAATFEADRDAILQRFTIKAVGTKNISPVPFQISFRYRITSVYTTVTRSFEIVPATGSLSGLRGDSTAFVYGNELLRVQVGAATLVIPAGVTGEMIGEAFEVLDPNLGPGNSGVPQAAAVLPGAAEVTYVPSSSQFMLSGNPDVPNAVGPNLRQFGAPWSGFLRGVTHEGSVNGGLRLPDGTLLKPVTTQGIANQSVRAYKSVDRRQISTDSGSVQLVRPNCQDPNNPQLAGQCVIVDAPQSMLGRVKMIVDGNGNSITLERNTAGVVTEVTTSDGRRWTIHCDAETGYVDSVVPGDGVGARFYERAMEGKGRITRVRSGSATGPILWQFDFDASGELLRERKNVDGDIKVVHEHVALGASGDRSRRDFTADGTFRQMDFLYDQTVSQGGRRLLASRLKEIRAFEGLNGTGAARITSFEHNVEDVYGNMTIREMVLPGPTASVRDRLVFTYDAPLTGADASFGILTKVVRTRPGVGGTLTLLDREIETRYGSGAQLRLLRLPRIVESRDARGNVTTFDYEDGAADQNGDSLMGELSNDLLSIIGPTVTMPAGSTPRTPQIMLDYSSPQVGNNRRLLRGYDEKFSATESRRVEFEYDAARRVTAEIVDPGGLNLRRSWLYTDNAATQDVRRVDEDGFATVETFGYDGRLLSSTRYLNALATPSSPLTGPFYRSVYEYDQGMTPGPGFLTGQVMDNKDQQGDPLTPGTIRTNFDRDGTGRLIGISVDPSGINARRTFAYNLQNDLTLVLDSSGRGEQREYDGRGLLSAMTPLMEGSSAVDPRPELSLQTRFTYTANGLLEAVMQRPSSVGCAGPMRIRMYDSFDRLQMETRAPAAGSGDNRMFHTIFEVDPDGHVTRQRIRSDTAGVMSDLEDRTFAFDEQGLNYEQRARLTAGTDGADDPRTLFEFDWSGRVTKTTMVGDATVAARVFTVPGGTTGYDAAGRLRRVTDSGGGQIDLAYNGRGLVTSRTEKLNATESATTLFAYDALGRAFLETLPTGQGQTDATATRISRWFNSRGQMLQKSWRPGVNSLPGNSALTHIFRYDAADRLSLSAVIKDLEAFPALVPASYVPDPTTDRVIAREYDTDGRLKFERSFNDASATPLSAETQYDAVGRVASIIDAAGNTEAMTYQSCTGLLDKRVINEQDAGGPREVGYAYDGFDRVRATTLAFSGGANALTTSIELDGLDRLTGRIEPRGTGAQTRRSTTGYDLAGRVASLTEDAGGALERTRSWEYTPHGLPKRMTATNAGLLGALLPQQTQYRWDTMGRTTRIVYPDSAQAPELCTDCTIMSYDAAGRLTGQTDPVRSTTFGYDRRSLLTSRSSSGNTDGYVYDPLGRLRTATRDVGGATDADAEIELAYTTLGDLDYEKQQIAGGTRHLVDYTHDQAGNLAELKLPSNTLLGFTHTALNQVREVTLGGLGASRLLLNDYGTDGSRGGLLSGRSVQTVPSDDFASNAYSVAFEYDAQRRTKRAHNTYTPNGAAAATVADYSYGLDREGSPSSIMVSGAIGFASDDRGFEADALGRLPVGVYAAQALGGGTGGFGSQSTSLTRVGSRERHADRAGRMRTYSAQNQANEYGAIDATALIYDGKGNLTRDEDGRTYQYDEQDRLIEVRGRSPGGGNASTGPLLARYAYDALGRRTMSVLAGSGGLTADGQTHRVRRYYYQGDQCVEERYALSAGSTSDLLLRWHVYGGESVDDRVASYKTAGSADKGKYFIVDRMMSVMGEGEFNGAATIKPYAYDAFGDSAGRVRHDSNGDLRIDLLDLCNLQECMGQAAASPALGCVGIHDRDDAGQSNGSLGAGDAKGLAQCMGGPTAPLTGNCNPEGYVPQRTGDFGLHGQMVEVLADGKVLMHWRARTYDPEHGRFLQRDPSGYVDGADLYEAFGGNPLLRVDPSGLDGVDLKMRHMEAARLAENGWSKEEQLDYLHPCRHNPAAQAVGSALWGAEKAVACAGFGLGVFAHDFIERPITTAIRLPRDIKDGLSDSFQTGIEAVTGRDRYYGHALTRNERFEAGGQAATSLGLFFAPLPGAAARATRAPLVAAPIMTPSIAEASTPAAASMGMLVGEVASIGDAALGGKIVGPGIGSDIGGVGMAMAMEVVQPRGGLPAYLLERLRAGRNFDAAQSARYPHNEVILDNANSAYGVRLDSYNPSTGEIIFRRLTQLANIKESTAIGYINEAVSKYSPDTPIADVPLNRRSGLAGEPLRGRLYFEVPVQIRPVPQSILDYATQKKVLIRDVDGTVYNP